MGYKFEDLSSNGVLWMKIHRQQDGKFIRRELVMLALIVLFNVAVVLGLVSLVALNLMQVFNGDHSFLTFFWLVASIAALLYVTLDSTEHK